MMGFEITCLKSHFYYPDYQDPKKGKCKIQNIFENRKFNREFTDCFNEVICT